MSASATTHAPKGLEGIVATTSSICYIDGDQGVLAIGDTTSHDLAEPFDIRRSLLFVVVWTASQSRRTPALKQRLAEERKLDASILALLKMLPKHALPMDVLRTLVSTLSYYDPEFDRNRPRREHPQGDSVDVADFHAGGELRSRPERETGG